MRQVLYLGLHLYEGNLNKKRFSRCDDSYNPGQIVKSSELTCEQQCEESQCTDHVLLPNPGDAIKRLCRALQMDERSSHITHLMPSFQIRSDIHGTKIPKKLKMQEKE